MTTKSKESDDGIFCIWCGKNDFKTPKFTELKQHLKEVHGVINPD